MNTPTNMIQRQSFRILLLSTALLLVAAPFADAAPLPAEPGHVVSLNGTWRFKLEQTNSVPLSRDNLNARTPITTSATFEPFYTTDYKEEAGWHDLAVPGNWEMAGYSPATYDQPDNASGFYRLWFEVPQSWKGRLVRLSFDGVQNGAQVWLNGSPVTVDQPSWGRTNYHESGWTAFQVDLTPQVEFGRTNLLALRVTKNTRSADLDSGDYFFLGGVYRPVTLFSVPQTHLADVTVQTRLLAGSSAEVKLLA
jgi:beta-galactosidase